MNSVGQASCLHRQDACPTVHDLDEIAIAKMAILQAILNPRSLKEFSVVNLKSFQLPSELSESSDDQRHTQTRIRIRIPQQYHKEPVISNLITQHQLTVTITAALLGANAQGDGWFDLLLQGSVAQIRAALLYINDLDLEIWCDSDAHNESW